MLDGNHERLFKHWLNEHRNLMFKVVKAYAASPQDQDDLFQEILLQLWSSVPRFEGRASETTWIYRVALNTALVWTRSQTRKRRRHLRFITHFTHAADTQHNCSDAIRNAQIVEQLYTAVRKLPKIDGSIILMYLDGLSYQQMADVLGISVSYVGVKLNRAKKQLAQLLKGLIDDF